MKSKFSTSWVSSKQVRKQRKYRYNAPLHLRHKFFAANLSSDLRKKYGKRSIVLRKGDEVLVMRGGFAKKKGKITKIDLKKNRVTIDGLNRKKRDGTKVDVYLNASNLQIQSLNLEDKKRIKGQAIEKKETETKKESTGENKDAPDKSASK